KKVTTLGSLSGGKDGFTEAEIGELQRQPFILSVGKIDASHFQAVLGMTFLRLQSEVFFESVPDSFLDIAPADWKWIKGSRSVPLIVSGDFIDLYNFGFAAGHNMPQISRQSIGLVDFDLTLRAPGKTFSTRAHIAGFSDRINSVLVPAEFMNWANENFGVPGKFRPARLIVKTKDPADDRLIRYVRERGLQTNAERLRSGKVRILLELALSATALIGGIIVLLAALVLVLYFQIMILRSDSEITLLSHLGVGWPAICWTYLKRAVLAVCLMMAGSLGILIWVKEYVGNIVETQGFLLPDGIAARTLAAAVLMFGVLLAGNAAAIIRGVRKLL
ncbi:MAG: hypothetical protein NTV54_03030, partial [Ignavibacteriales bacterium]|nr:hypothetical protein [Ignavibacteriales bacterium]